MTEPGAIGGIELARRFHADLVEPWLAATHPMLRYAAALIGYGSELLGFDDAMSRDHGWGPRVLIFLGEAEFAANADALVTGFSAAAPETFLGAPVAFPDRPPLRGAGARRDARHGLEVWTLEAALSDLLALEPGELRAGVDWLGLSEQRLLAFTAGAVFRDDEGALTAARARLVAFPHDVRLYKLACQWRRIAEEQAFVGRTGASGDEIGSRVIAARLARDVMRLGFLIEGRYAPYPKWFGTAFARLPCAAELTPALEQALAAPDWRAREAALAQAYLVAAELQRSRGRPGAFEPRIGRYFGRPFTVINAHEISRAMQAEIADPALKALPIIGSLDQVTDSTPVTEAPVRARRAMAALLDDGEAGPLEEP